MKTGKIVISLLVLLLASCGGGSDSDDSDSAPTYMGGVWRGNLVLQKNDCGLQLEPSFNFINLVSQVDIYVDLDDEQGFRFSGRVTGSDGFSVDAIGPRNDRIPDGRICDFTYRYRYESINDDGDRTAKVRFLYVGDCSDQDCESEYGGDGMRD